MKFSFIPKEEQFFDLLDRTADYLVEGGALLEDLTRDYKNVDHKLERINGLEHACDEVTHTTLEKLETTFITPFDREDIHQLALRLDDVLDMITASACRLQMFRIVTPREPVLALAVVIHKMTKVLASAIRQLRHRRNYSQATADCIELHRLENEADEINKTAIGELFDHETNAIELLRWKEIYENLETVTDCGEDAANVIQGIIVKNA